MKKLSINEATVKKSVYTLSQELLQKNAAFQNIQFSVVDLVFTVCGRVA